MIALIRLLLVLF